MSGGEYLRYTVIHSFPSACSLGAISVVRLSGLQPGLKTHYCLDSCLPSGIISTPCIADVPGVSNPAIFPAASAATPSQAHAESPDRGLQVTGELILLLLPAAYTISVLLKVPFSKEKRQYMSETAAELEKTKMDRKEGQMPFPPSH